MNDSEPTKKITITYSNFVLPFVPEPNVDEEKQSDSRYEQLELMQEQLPGDCIFLGELNTGIDGPPGLSWVVEDYYYLMPWNTPDYNWALFRITWDDNWGRFEWNATARIKGVTDAKEAVRRMFKGLLKSWGYDLRRKEYSVHREFLEQI